MSIRAVLSIAAATVTLVAARSPGRADQLAPDELAHKNDGGYVTGLPLFAYSTDLGLGLGASYDTRDFEPDPNRGTFVDVALDAGTVALGSQYDYLRFLIASRAYWSPIPDRADLVLANRFVFEAQTNGAPFFSMNTLPFTDDPRTGLGGHRTLRGFRQDRFVGSVMTLDNTELRWTFGHADLWRQHFGFIVAPFVDVGRAYDSLGDLTLRDWQSTYGAAFRIAWNLATIITVDYGRSAEDAGLYVNFNHNF